MKKDDNLQLNSQSPQELEALLNEAKEALLELDEIRSKNVSKFDEIEGVINESLNNLENIFADLNQIEEEAGNEIDRFVLEKVEELIER
jgi:hypothetical protein